MSGQNCNLVVIVASLRRLYCNAFKAGVAAHMVFLDFNDAVREFSYVVLQRL